MSICTIANNQTIEDNCTDCKAIFSNIKKTRLYKKVEKFKIKRVDNRLESIIKEFAEYKIKKNREIKKLQSELLIYKKCSKKQKEIDIIHPSTYLQTDITWVEIIVEDGVDIFQLAIKYYGDRDEYRQIYLANKNTIGDNLKITEGMTLKIPIVNQFEEQPMILNRD
jgi:hypothetical protein